MHIFKNIVYCIFKLMYTRYSDCGINIVIVVDNILTSNNFKVVYSKSGGFGSCSNNFYQVWQK